MLLRCDFTMTGRGVSPDPQVDFLSSLRTRYIVVLCRSDNKANWLGIPRHKRKNSNWMPDDIALAAADKQYSQPTTQHWTIGRRGTLVYRWDYKKCGVTSVLGCLYRKPPSTFFIFIPLQARIIEKLGRIFTPSKLRCHLLPFS